MSNGPEVLVPVRLKYDPKGVPDGISCPNRTELSKSGGQKAHWTLEAREDAGLSIKMKKDTKPFKHHPETDAADKKHVRSEAPTEGAVGDQYGYSVLVDVAGKHLSLDPIIIITP
jgi:hypothetical protein